MSERKITVIPPKINLNTEKKREVKRLNVAAYCRVSTAQEEQETSYEAQVSYYTKLITENPSWNLAGIYADDGISGTNTKKRDDFNTMMGRCLQKGHSIDIILKENGIKTIRGNAEWNISSIRTILINEKHIDDAMAQKTFTTDYLTKERKENRGELQKYYVENAHEAIIPREIFYRVQEKLNQKRISIKNQQ